jgi:hypothetical protein
MSMTLPNDPEDEDLEEDIQEEELEEEDTDGEEETDVEKQARALGWHPRNEYLGPAHKWVPADEFIRRGENILPILRENHRRLQGDYQRQADELRGLRSQLTEQSEVLNEVRQRMRTADERAYERAKTEWERKQREAAQEGDVEAHDKATEALKQIEKSKATPTQPERRQPAQETPTEIAAFIRENPWYSNDQVLNMQMQAEHVRLKQDEPGLSLAENLERAKEAVMARYPQKFGMQPRQPRRPSASPVATPTPGPRGPLPRRGASPIDQIQDSGERAQAREAFNRMKRQMPDFTEKEYMTYYNDPHADALAVRHSREKA